MRQWTHIYLAGCALVAASCASTPELEREHDKAIRVMDRTYSMASYVEDFWSTREDPTIRPPMWREFGWFWDAYAVHVDRVGARRAMRHLEGLVETYKVTGVLTDPGGVPFLTESKLAEYLNDPANRTFMFTWRFGDPPDWGRIRNERNKQPFEPHRKGLEELARQWRYRLWDDGPAPRPITERPEMP